MERNVPLSDDELLAKCDSGDPITSSDLGIRQASSDGLKTYTEGFNVLSFKDNSTDDLFS